MQLFHHVHWTRTPIEHSTPCADNGLSYSLPSSSTYPWPNDSSPKLPLQSPLTIPFDILPPAQTMACPTPAVRCSSLYYAWQQTWSPPHNGQQFAASWWQAMAEWLPIKVTPPSQWLHGILLLQLPLYHLQFNAFKPTMHTDHHHISPWNLGGGRVICCGYDSFPILDHIAKPLPTHTISSFSYSFYDIRLMRVNSVSTL